MTMLSTPFKYKQVKASILQLSRALPIGARLPAERKLAISHACNFLTVRRALKELVHEGIVVRQIGSGTFVSAHKGTGLPVSNRIGVLICQGLSAYPYRVLQALADASLHWHVELRLRWVRNLHEDSLALKKEGCVALTLPWFAHERINEVHAFVRSCILPVSLPISTSRQEENGSERHEVFGEMLQSAVRTSCEYFRKLGRRRIALLGPECPANEGFGKALNTYARFMAHENLTNICGLVSPGAQSMDKLAEQWRAYRGDLAVISYDDGHALRLMTAMHKIGLSAPIDFTIIGCNDTEAGEYSDPPLSTIRQNFEYAGYWLIKNALSLASGKPALPLQLPRLQLLVRATCGGRAKINADLHAQLPALDIVTNEINGPTQSLQKTHW